MTSTDGFQGEPESPARSPHAESEYVEVGQAHITVAEADLSITPGARRAARHLAWSLSMLFLVTIGLLAASFLFQNSQLQQVRSNSAGLAAAVALEQKQIHADCGFYGHLSGLPVTLGPDGKASRLGVQIISDSRGAFLGHGCPGTLPPPSSSFEKWAAYYHLTIS